jgi:hypothetical protein
MKFTARHAPESAIIAAGPIMLNYTCRGRFWKVDAPDKSSNLGLQILYLIAFWPLSSSEGSVSPLTL